MEIEASSRTSIELVEGRRTCRVGEGTKVDLAKREKLKQTWPNHPGFLKHLKINEKEGNT